MTETVIFADIQAASEFCRQHPGFCLELSEDYDAWLAVRTVPGHLDAIAPHNPLVPDPGCAECRREGWLTVPEIDPAQEREAVR